MSIRPVYVVDGVRTPFLKSKNRPGPFAAGDLAVQAGRALLVRQKFAPQELDEVILGCAAPSVDEVNIGRVAALRMGCGEKVPGWTVMRNCASGMQALDSGLNNILAGRSQLVLAGGVDALSRAPLLYNDRMVNWFSDLAAAKSGGQRAALFARMPFKALLAPVIGIMKGLTDPMVGLLMGQTAENLAHRFGITREQMDAYSVRSHQRVARAQDDGPLRAGGGEVEALYDAKGNAYPLDDGVRRDASMEGLAKLKPFFDRKYGNVTPGNSSQITDGAAWLILASEEAVRTHDLTPIGRIVDSQWAGLDPAQMGLGPVHAATPILQRHGLELADLDYWEINEAFAAQVLGCLAAWKDEKYCKEQLGLERAMGELDEEKLNVDGGAVALGHPVGASGARIVLHMLKLLKRKNAKRGMASICIGGGLGGAMLLEAA
ncbi:MAG: acetyl-CoA C-acetyltransferase [Betaproteobacteria bacterium]|nr:acetyl-CoA C-acetyltransferase [Betaproteobacteria bacterium]MDH5219595.1 acetyl-CoA C-acetyltransferase [Betaproteobacteria bacterium]MDH5349983.1 acetyl-CoA C-acetyltransferase [Betaproteobacteria bacterium]